MIINKEDITLLKLIKSGEASIFIAMDLYTDKNKFKRLMDLIEAV